MGFEFMKKIDYWVGIPICFVLSILNLFLQIFSSGHKKVPQKILLIKPSEMGAIVLSAPMVNKLKEKYPNVQIYYLTFKSNEKLIHAMDIVPKENVFTINERSFGPFLKEVFSVIKQMRKEKFDVVVDLEFFSRFTAILSFFSGAKKRIGFHRFTIEGVYRGDLFTHRIQYNPHLHVSDMYSYMTEVIDLPFKESPETDYEPASDYRLPEFKSDKEKQDSLKKSLKDLGVPMNTKWILICPGEGRIPLREWPLENFQKISQDILKDESYCVMLIGTAKARRKAQAIIDYQGDKERCVNLMGKTSVEELLTLFTLSEALVVNDSGLSHIAALTPIKQYVLFGPETPKIFSSLGKNIHIFYRKLACSPCLSVFNHRNSACQDNLCLKSISPEQVYSAIFGK